jgi:hypothetical protein
MNASYETKSFDTGTFFSGGSGMFLQYDDIVQAIGLMVVFKLISGDNDYGLPIRPLRSMSPLSLIEWYLHRRYPNPIKTLDYLDRFTDDEADSIYRRILQEDDSLYRLAPPLNVQRLLSVYKRQSLNFPVYVYTKEDTPILRETCRDIFPGIPVKLVSGDLREATAECRHNCTFIVSDIEFLAKLTEVLDGTYSHIILAADYRYNYKPHYRNRFKYSLSEMMDSHNYLRIETTSVFDPTSVARYITRLAGIIGIGKGE